MAEEILFVFYFDVWPGTPTLAFRLINQHTTYQATATSISKAIIWQIQVRYEGCLLYFGIWQSQCCNLPTDSSIVRLNIFEVIRTQKVLTYKRTTYQTMTTFFKSLSKKKLFGGVVSQGMISIHGELQFKVDSERQIL